MKEDENILEKAIEAIRNERTPQGPPQELVDATLTNLTEAQRQTDTAYSGGAIGLMSRLNLFKGVAKVAAAAVLLLVAGYAVGRLSAPPPPDLEELQAALEPAIRRNVVAQLRNDLQTALATCYDRLSDELGRRQREETAKFAAQTLTVSSSITNGLLAELIESIKAAQAEERQWLTAVIEQMETERLRDDVQIARFAMRTEDELERTKQGVAQLLSFYGRLDGPATHKVENSKDTHERMKQ